MDQSEPGSLAARHLDLIYELMEFVGHQCPQHFDYEMDQRFAELLSSFNMLYDSERLPERGLRERRFSASLRHNYTVAQCSTLLAFANSVAVLAAHTETPELLGALRGLWVELARAHRAFFASDARPA